MYGSAFPKAVGSRAHRNWFADHPGSSILGGPSDGYRHCSGRTGYCSDTKVASPNAPTRLANHVQPVRVRHTGLLGDCHTIECCAANHCDACEPQYAIRPCRCDCNSCRLAVDGLFAALSASSLTLRVHRGWSPPGPVEWSPTFKRREGLLTIDNFAVSNGAERAINFKRNRFVEVMDRSVEVHEMSAAWVICIEPSNVI